MAQVHKQGTRSPRGSWFNKQKAKRRLFFSFTSSTVLISKGVFQHVECVPIHMVNSDREIFISIHSIIANVVTLYITFTLEVRFMEDLNLDPL